MPQVLSTASSIVVGVVGTDCGTITANFWDMETSGCSWSAGGIRLTIAEMKTTVTFMNAGWSPEIWLLEDVSYPRLLNVGPLAAGH